MRIHTYIHTYRYEAAVKCYRGALEIQTRTLGSGHIDVASTKDSLGVTLWRLGLYQESITLYDDALQVCLCVYMCVLYVCVYVLYIYIHTYMHTYRSVSLFSVP